MQYDLSSVRAQIREHQEMIDLVLVELVEDIYSAGCILCNTVKRGGKVMFCGNGGSAADSQHLAAELVSRFRRDRRGLPALALTVNTSVMTSIGNDYDYGFLFARQVEALGNDGDVLVGITTSGNSTNVLEAFRVARQKGIYCIALTGGSGGQIVQLADQSIRVPSSDTARIQEAHIMIGHIWCDMVESQIAGA